MPRDEKKNHIEKLKDGKYRLLSHEGKNLGTFDSREKAEEHERQVEYFKTHSKSNARGFAEVYFARHMEPGLCGYEEENILVDADAMKRMAPSFAGKPVYVGHQDVNFDSLETDMDGVVADCFYNELDGWLWSKIIVTTDKGKAAVAKGWAVSNAYTPTAWEGGGENHALDYNRKIREAEFTHLAIVPDPRYEQAKIFTPDEFKSYQAEKRAEIDELKNSKRKKPMFKMFRNKREEVSIEDADDETLVELRNGKVVKLGDINKVLAEAGDDSKLSKSIRRYEQLMNEKEKDNESEDEEEKKDRKKNKKNESEKEEEKDNESDEDEDKKDNEAEKDEDDDKVLWHGKKYNAEDFMKEYNSRKKNKKNAEEDDDDKKNSREHFDDLKNARKNSKSQAMIDLPMDRMNIGKQNYGSAE